MLEKIRTIDTDVEDDADEVVEDDTDEVVADLLYTMFQTMDEYIAYLKAHGNPGDDLTKMQKYVEKEMRWYAHKVYKVEVDET